MRRLLAITSFAIVVGQQLATAEPVRLPSGESLDVVDFERHVAPLLGQLGCNSGSCHGSFQGKGGFRLSLFGHSVEMDYAALTRDANGRRVNSANPDNSLVLLKPSMQVIHKGGRRFRTDSWQYNVLRKWIADGARRSNLSGVVKRMEVQPGRRRVDKFGDKVQLKVFVDFEDGTRSDVTPFCGFRSKDDSIADVSQTGLVSTLQSGDTSIVVSYRGNLATSQILVPAVGHGVAWPKLATANCIDEAVFAKLRELNIVPSDLASDTDFLRRVTIDTIGQLPSPDDVRSFVADPRADKRGRKIEELLTHPLHAALWATRLCDITGNNIDAMISPEEIRPKQAKMWHDWFRKRIAENEPYDAIVKGVLCSTSRDGDDIQTWMKREMQLVTAARSGFNAAYADRKSLDLYWQRNDTIQQRAERIAAAFLGVRIECAQCHKHPFDRWTQTDYRSFANVFAGVQFGSSPELKAALFDMLEARRAAAKRGEETSPIPRVREVYLGRPQGQLRDPETKDVLKPKALGGPVVSPDGDRRKPLFDWLVQPTNPFFARSFVNRVWAHYFGAGLVEPVDDLSIANPASHEPLLQLLADDFVKHGFEIRRLERLVLNSSAYQLSAFPNATNKHDRRNHSRARVRRLIAEVVLDVVDCAVGHRQDFGADVPPGIRAVEIAPSRIRDERVAKLFQVFNRPTRASICDCERPNDPALSQTLYLMTDPTLLKMIEHGRLAELLKSKKSDTEIIDELFLATFSRFPDSDEQNAALSQIARAGDREKALKDTFWALLNSREFITNH